MRTGREGRGRDLAHWHGARTDRGGSQSRTSCYPVASGGQIPARFDADRRARPSGNTRLERSRRADNPRFRLHHRTRQPAHKRGSTESHGSELAPVVLIVSASQLRWPPPLAGSGSAVAISAHRSAARSMAPMTSLKRSAKDWMASRNARPSARIWLSTQSSCSCSQKSQQRFSLVRASQPGRSDLCGGDGDLGEPVWMRRCGQASGTAMGSSCSARIRSPGRDGVDGRHPRLRTHPGAAIPNRGAGRVAYSSPGTGRDSVSTRA